VRANARQGLLLFSPSEQSPFCDELGACTPGSDPPVAGPTLLDFTAGSELGSFCGALSESQGRPPDIMSCRSPASPNSSKLTGRGLGHLPSCSSSGNAGLSCWDSSCAPWFPSGAPDPSSLSPSDGGPSCTGLFVVARVARPTVVDGVAEVMMTRGDCPDDSGRAACCTAGPAVCFSC